ncbi:MAG: glycosyltransferase family 2 protein [Bacillota bacterium]|jgi:cellulose synthase/poly-beta-1,6-N-acetylglucosamine synthase-like glycosyltransferase|nr:glycosyltransferase family 2 protein [Bacillota bacterium]NLL26805.1 glycosyltransferase family 2 protein [Erysipelotrichia bacterium]
MERLSFINYVISLLFFLCYSYQFLYILIKIFSRQKNENKSVEKKNYAVLICARNEEKVIGELIDSIHQQTYPQEKITIFVMADNCNDDTEKIAKNKGAITYHRIDKVLVGKGYALDTMLKFIKREYPDQFDGYFVFDADNILKENYIEEMNKVFVAGNDIVTSYRNSKNYDSNWISAGYTLSFLRESQFLNGARNLIHSSCAVSGTGFLVSDAIIKEQRGWPFHMLTEDIEFSIYHIIQGKKIAYCEKAMLFDEQPTKFSQSVHQRLRWIKGYIQVFNRYGKELITNMFKGSFSCFDMVMNSVPAYILSFVSIAANVILSIYTAVYSHDYMLVLKSIAQLILSMYLTMFALGLITTITEWKNIYASNKSKILYLFTFPVFMFTYIPISIAALFLKVSWKPIEHGIYGRKVEGLMKNV